LKFSCGIVVDARAAPTAKMSIIAAAPNSVQSIRSAPHNVFMILPLLLSLSI
jgi:hypothetical protein